MKPLVAFSVLGWIGIFAGTECLRAADLQTLIDRSPFSLPSQAADGNAAEPAGTLEFRGLVTDDAGTAYSIFDTSTNKGRWLRADDTTGPVQVKGFDVATNLLDVEQNGRAVRLAMKHASIQAGQTLAAMTPANPTPANPAVIRRHRGSDESRLKAVADEVQKHRALRLAAIVKARDAARPASTSTPAPVPAQPGN